MITQPKCRVPRSTKPSWEDGYGMVLDAVVYTRGIVPKSTLAQRRQAAARRLNGQTPASPSYMFGTRMLVGRRPWALLTLVVPGGGYRMVAFDESSLQSRELWRAKNITLKAATSRHFDAVDQFRREWSATNLRGDLRVPQPLALLVRFDDRESTLPLDVPWRQLTVQLTEDAKCRGPIGDVARVAVDKLNHRDLVGVAFELLDASAVPFAPLAQAATKWLRLLGYDRAHALTDGGDPVMSDAA